MKNSRFLLIMGLVIAGMIAFIACQKQLDSSILNDPPPVDTTQTNNNLPPDELVTASLTGRVLDENGIPVKDATVIAGGASTSTDVNGVFQFSNIRLYSRFGFVKVTKPGYFTGSRTFATHANADNFVRINLIPRVSKGSFAAGSGGTITIQTGNTVAFEGGALVNAGSGASYSGNVHVFAAYLNPIDADLPLRMPGDLRGITLTNQEVSLKSFGMVVVELEGDAGEKLQIASGKKATVTMAIPGALQSTAPDSIAMWYFNDTTGKWIEQGKGAKQGNNYTGQVSHFSYWNYDAPYPSVSFKVQLKDQMGSPVAYTYVEVNTTNYSGRGHGYTDSAGYAQGLIPSGVPLTLDVVNNCGDRITVKNIDPVTSSIDLGTVTVSFGNIVLSLTGTVLDCYNDPVANGYVNAYLDGLNYRASIVNGSFTFNIYRCANTQTNVELTAVDLGSLQQSNASTVSVSSGNVNVGQISACGTSLEQFVKVTINGTDYSLTAPPDSITYGTQGSNVDVWAITAYGINPATSVNFVISNPTNTGVYPVPNFYLNKGNTLYKNYNTQCTITRFGNVNGFIEGDFSGTVTRDSSTTFPLTGNFRIRRTY